MKPFLIVLSLSLFNLACGGVSTSEKSKTTETKQDTDVAIVGDVVITLNALDESTKAQIRRADMAHAKQVAEIRRASLDNLIQRKLLELESKSRGLPDIESLIKAEVIGKVKPPSEEELKAFYQENKEEIGSAEFESIKMQIQTYLIGQAHEEKAEALLISLRAKYPVKDQLEPYRVPVGTHGPSKGPADARVVIVEYADFECPYCGQTSKTVLDIQKKYPKDVRVIFRHFPLSFHAQAMPAAIATRCADKQGQFWSMHDRLFAQSKKLSGEVIDEAAQALGLDIDRFAKCMADGSEKRAVEAEMEEGSTFGVEGTPAFFVNGIPLGGAQPFSAFESLVLSELK